MGIVVLVAFATVLVVGGAKVVAEPQGSPVIWTHQNAPVEGSEGVPLWNVNDEDIRPSRNVGQTGKRPPERVREQEPSRAAPQKRTETSSKSPLGIDDLIRLLGDSPPQTVPLELQHPDSTLEQIRLPPIRLEAADPGRGVPVQQPQGIQFLQFQQPPQRFVQQPIQQIQPFQHAPVQQLQPQQQQLQRAPLQQQQQQQVQQPQIHRIQQHQQQQQQVQQPPIHQIQQHQQQQQQQLQQPQIHQLQQQQQLQQPQIIQLQQQQLQQPAVHQLQPFQQIQHLQQGQVQNEPIQQHQHAGPQQQQQQQQQQPEPPVLEFLPPAPRSQLQPIQNVLPPPQQPQPFQHPFLAPAPQTPAGPHHQLVHFVPQQLEGSVQPQHQQQFVVQQLSPVTPQPVQFISPSASPAPPSKAPTPPSPKPRPSQRPSPPPRQQLRTHFTVSPTAVPTATESPPKVESLTPTYAIPVPQQQPHRVPPPPPPPPPPPQAQQPRIVFLQQPHHQLNQPQYHLLPAQSVIQPPPQQLVLQQQPPKQQQLVLQQQPPKQQHLTRYAPNAEETSPQTTTTIEASRQLYFIPDPPLLAPAPVVESLPREPLFRGPVATTVAPTLPPPPPPPLPPLPPAPPTAQEIKARSKAANQQILHAPPSTPSTSVVTSAILSTTTTSRPPKRISRRRGTLMEELEREGLTVLVDLLTYTGQHEPLANEAYFTVFAPSNEALLTLMKGMGSVDAALQRFEQNPDVLRTLLGHHLMSGVAPSKELEDDMTGESMAGTRLRVNAYDALDGIEEDGRLLTVNGGRLVKRDIRARNGIIHVIDRVLFPLPVGNIIGTLRADADYRFDKFLRLIQAAGLEARLSSMDEGSFTVFAPTNKALDEALGARAYRSVLRDERKARNLVLDHIVNRSWFSVAVDGSQRVVSVTGKSIGLYRKNGLMKAGAANVVSIDLPADNGVVHAIDALMD